MIYIVITFNDSNVLSFSRLQTYIHRVAVASVRLIYDFEMAILFLKAFKNGNS